MRMDVWNRTREEGDWPLVLQAYEKAVGIMRSLDPPNGKPENPLGWRFQAAMHGIATPESPPGKPVDDTSNKLWCNCQHGSWFFLPWHRMYLAAFECIVQYFLEDKEWSLPYWSAIDPKDPAKAVVPPAFLDRTRPDNNLQTDQRSQIVKTGQPFYGLIGANPFNDELIKALQATPFATAAGTGSFGGGEEVSPIFLGEELGLLENVPHGAVHGFVGNDYDATFKHVVKWGWMGSVHTAGWDPLFWLHHANMDRLWEAWRSVDSIPAHNNSSATEFLNTTFHFPGPENEAIGWSVGEVLDTKRLGYVYESLAPAELAQQALPDAGRLREEIRVRSRGSAAAVRKPPPRVVGAADNVPLTRAEPLTVEISGPRPETVVTVGPRSAFATTEPPDAERIYLRLEGVTGTAAAPLYSVYLNVPAGEDPIDYPDRRVGSLATFRLAEASRSDNLRGGEGLSVTFDITEQRARLMAEGRWDPARVELRFVSHVPGSPEEEEAGDVGQMQRRAPDVQVRRVAIVVG